MCHRAVGPTDHRAGGAPTRGRGCNRDRRNSLSRSFGIRKWPSRAGGRERLRAGVVAARCPPLGPLVRGGADLRRCFRVDQVLQAGLQHPAEHVRVSDAGIRGVRGDWHLIIVGSKAKPVSTNEKPPAFPREAFRFLRPGETKSPRVRLLITWSG